MRTLWDATKAILKFSIGTVQSISILGTIKFTTEPKSITRKVGGCQEWND